jgi:hypothetical protein
MRPVEVGVLAVSDGLVFTLFLVFWQTGRLASGRMSRGPWNSELTTYSYHDNADPDPGKRGNLATVTNALGYLIEVTAYDFKVISPIVHTVVCDTSSRL